MTSRRTLALTAALLASACAAACSQASAGRDETAAASGAADVDAARLREELTQCRLDAERARAVDAARIQSLETELAEVAADRIRREKEWLAYTQAVTKLGAIAVAPEAPTGDPALARAVQTSAATEESNPDSFGEPVADSTAVPIGGTLLEPALGAAPADLAPTTSGSEASSTSKLAAEKRDREIFLALRSLFVIEQVSGFDLLEAGTLVGGATGPVVMRVLDERGRPLGTLYAERLRLQASRAARTLTLVLEDGYERMGGEKTPFTAVPNPPPGSAPSAGGTEAPGGATSQPVAPAARNARRMLLPDVDPRDWIEALPELFAPEEKAPPPDDGLWSLGALRAALNDLLRLDAAGGFYRVQGLGGVQGDTLRDVSIDHLDRAGRLERKLFADRMRVLPADQGIVIVLESGAQMRGDEKTPFLDGRFRIFLPRADLAEWRKAIVPGLSPVPEPKPR